MIPKSGFRFSDQIMRKVYLTMRVALALLLLINAPALAQESCPSRLVEIVVPFAPGGGTDIIARVVAERLSESLRQRFLIINRPGAATNIGTEAVVNAPPDAQ